MLEAFATIYGVSGIGGKRMLRNRIAVLGALLLTPLAQADAADWRTSTYETDGFSAEFFGSVQIAPNQLDEETKQRVVRSTIYFQDGGTFAYMVSAVLYAPNAAVNLDESANRAMAALRCGNTASDTKSAMPDATMREVYASNCANGVRVGVRFFQRGQWFYQTMYLVSVDDQVADAKHFLTSFKLIRPKT